MGNSDTKNDSFNEVKTKSVDEINKHELILTLYMIKIDKLEVFEKAGYKIDQKIVDDFYNVRQRLYEELKWYKDDEEVRITLKDSDLIFKWIRERGFIIKNIDLTKELTSDP